MSDPIELRIDDKAAVAALARLAQRVSNLQPVMRKVAGIMHDAVEENFEQEGRPKWKSLKASTTRQREKKGHWPGKILQQTGSMASSIEEHHDRMSARVGTNKKYAAIQHFGGKAGRGRKVDIPARPFMKLTTPDLKEIVECIKGYVDKGK